MRSMLPLKPNSISITVSSTSNRIRQIEDVVVVIVQRDVTAVRAAILLWWDHGREVEHVLSGNLRTKDSRLPVERVASLARRLIEREDVVAADEDEKKHEHGQTFEIENLVII